MYQFAWIKHQSANFLQSYKGFVVLISLFPLLFLKMCLNNKDFYQFDVGHDQFLPMFLKSSTIFSASILS